MDGTDEGMPRDLLVVRHGESEGNRVLKGETRDPSLRSPEFERRPQSEWRLTDTGRRQAATAGRWIRTWMADEGIGRFDAYYCSPYVRTRETAALLAVPDAGWQVESLIRERDRGLWEVFPKHELAERFPISHRLKKANRFLWRPESGESTADVDLRGRAILGRFAREMAGRRVLCVAHEDLMWALRFRLEKLTIEEFIEQDDSEHHRIPNAGILHYTRVDAEGHLHPKFARVRLVDPSDPDRPTEWWDIVRPRFSNEDLLAQVDRFTPLSLPLAAADVVARARRIASRAHADQVDKSGQPYIGHPRRVAARLADPDARAAAWLHDVIEDCGITAEELRRTAMPDAVVDAVVALTKEDGVDLAAYYARVRANPLALQVKVADVADNLDPARVRALAAVKPKKAAKLRHKYATALLALSGESWPDGWSAAQVIEALRPVTDGRRDLSDAADMLATHARLDRLVADFDAARSASTAGAMASPVDVVGLRADLERQLRLDHGRPSVWRAWGSSTTVEDGTPLLGPGAQRWFDDLVRPDLTAGAHTRHAGALHTYGYLCSGLVTAYGWKRTRWAGGDVADAAGVDPALLAPVPAAGTLLGNVTMLAGRLLGIAELAELDAPDGLVPTARLVRQVVEVATHERSADGELHPLAEPIEIRSSFFARPASDDERRVDWPTLLVHTIVRSGVERLNTVFALAPGTTKEADAGDGVDIELSYNAVIEHVGPHLHGSRRVD